MPDDAFAQQVERLTRQHRGRHTPAMVAEVTLQRWLTMRNRYRDPFCPELFDSIDVTLSNIPASVDPAPPSAQR